MYWIAFDCAAFDEPAIVIKVDRNPLRHGTLSAIRSLGRAGVPIHVIQKSRRLPAARSRYVAGRYAWPASLAGHEDAVGRLHDLAERLRARAVLFAVDEVGATFLSESADRLTDAFDFASAAAEGPRAVIDKHRRAGGDIDSNRSTVAVGE